MTKLLNSPNTLHEIPISLNTIVYLIKASISHDQMKLIKKRAENFLTKLCYYSQAAALQGPCRSLTMGERRSVTSLFPPPSCALVVRYMYVPMESERQRGMMRGRSVIDHSSWNKYRTWILLDRLLITALLLIDYPSTCLSETIFSILLQ